MIPDDEEYWFEPKRYGYGTGLPLTWQAWAATLGYCLFVTGAALLLAERSMFAFVVITLATTGAFLLVCARKTRGGWHWRWGERG